MPNPAAVPDRDGEWLELHNPRTDTVRLDEGCTLDDGSTTPPVFEPALTIAAGGYAVLARSERAGVSVDRVMSFSLNDAGDRVVLSCGGVEIDRASYGDVLTPVAGDSLSLDSSGVWCTSQAPTPGAPNPPCEEAVDQ